MTTGTVLAFLAIATLAYVTPGPDWFVVMRHAGTSRRAGWVASLGVQSGLLVHVAAAAVGVSAVLVASAHAFTVLKLLGAAYLVLLGVRALRDSMHRRREPTPDATGLGGNAQDASSLVRVWRQSFTANVLNPKAALFFVAVLPQFLDPGSPIASQVVVLGLLDIALGVAWWGVFVLGIRGVHSVLGGDRSRVLIDRTAGVALLGMGGALALTGRRTA